MCSAYSAFLCIACHSHWSQLSPVRKWHIWYAQASRFRMGGSGHHCMKFKQSAFTGSCSLHSLGLFFLIHIFWHLLCMWFPVAASFSLSFIILFKLLWKEQCYDLSTGDIEALTHRTPGTLKLSVSLLPHSPTALSFVRHFLFTDNYWTGEIPVLAKMVVFN